MSGTAIHWALLALALSALSGCDAVARFTPGPARDGQLAEQPAADLALDVPLDADSVEGTTCSQAP